MKAHIHYSDLLLLHKLFCSAKSSFFVFDPYECLINDTQEDDSNRVNDSLTAEVIFNLSEGRLKFSGPSQFVFHFNTSNMEGATEFLYYNNPDQTIRWIVPSENNKPYFLELYNSNTLKGSLIRKSIELSYKLNMPSNLASGRFYLEHSVHTHIDALLNKSQGEGYSIFTGTKGENRKAIIEIHDQNNITHFIKVALDKKPLELINNERHMLTSLSKYDFSSLSIPTPSEQVEPYFVKLTNVKPDIIISSNRITEIHLRALIELYSKSNSAKAIGETGAWDAISNQLQLLENDPSIHSEIDASKVYKILNALVDIHNQIDINKIVPVSICHGDFTPWNMYMDKNRLYLYDWEMSDNNMPMLFDLFHFIFQTEVLINHGSWDEVEFKIDEMLQLPHAKELINKFGIDIDLHLKLYLLFNISYYLRLYMNQRQLHKQAHWLVAAWERALCK
ncbi:MAG TPA: phosphotransferase [Bacteroidia bacterium]|nr:phosphotransferase [Bacteroidia bacterium]